MTHGNRTGIVSSGRLPHRPEPDSSPSRPQPRPAALTICLGSSCFTRGNDENLPRIQEWLRRKGLEERVHLKGSRCEGRCQHGPNLRVGDRFLPDATPGSILEELEKVL